MEATEHIWMNGGLVPWDEAQVHVLTHGLHYGTGIFEGIRAYETEKGAAVFRLTEHMERFSRGAKAIGMPLDYSVDELVEVCKEVLRVNDLSSGYIRPVAFYGSGAMGLNPAGANVHVVVAAWEWGAYLGEEGVQNGIRVAVSSWRRIDQQSLMPNAKVTGGYINSVLAKTAAVKAGYDEAILLNLDGVVAEGSGENLFLVRDGVVYSPPTSAGALDGLTRDAVRTMLVDAGYDVREATITRTDLYYADELFFTGTAAEVTPVREVDDRAVGTGKPGPVTRVAQQLFMDTVTGKNERYSDWLEYA
ncbi:MAG: branched-chain amino acid transaminase [Actinomycetota bacterium]